MMVEKLAQTNVKAVSSKTLWSIATKSRFADFLCGILSIYGRIVTIEWIEKESDANGNILQSH